MIVERMAKGLFLYMVISYSHYSTVAARLAPPRSAQSISPLISIAPSSGGFSVFIRPETVHHNFWVPEAAAAMKLGTKT
jgi:hypothetical protein